MDLNEEQAGGVTVLQVMGRIDSTTAPVLGERLTAMVGAAGARVVVDFSQLDYISSAGFRILLLAAKRADQTTSKLVLCGVSGKVRQLFDLGGFLDLFTIAHTREEGIAAAG
ncbi:MAG: STAS domain-containing protein [Betaproteobacteria bacterium]|nr:STAS domain-containing protein [Betaproteobacteria bacterium]